MGFFGKIGSFISKAARKIGEFGGKALSKIGSLKSGWDTVNGLSGGMLSKAVEGIPMIGGTLKAGGDLLKLTHGGGGGASLSGKATGGGELVSNGRKVYGASPPETMKQRDQRRHHMGLENI